MIRPLPASVLWPTARTSLMAWMFLRVFMGAGAYFLAPGLEFLGPSPLVRVINPLTSFLLMTGVAGVALADLRLTREGIWVRNLGVSRQTVAGAAFLFAGVLELGVWFCLRLWGGGY